jgi:hypothetical protein
MMMAFVSASHYTEIVVPLAIVLSERHAIVDYGMSHTQPCTSPYYTQEHHTDDI